MPELTPEPEEDQERSKEQLVVKPVPYTVEDVEAAVRVLHANRYDGEEDIDEDARIEIVALVLSTVAPKIHEAAYQAGREDAAREEDQKRSNEKLRLALARDALVRTGYFTPDQVGDDIAPRIIELWSAISLGRSAGGVGDNPEEQRPSLQHQERSEEQRRLERICQSCGQTARYCKCEQDQ